MGLSAIPAAVAGLVVAELLCRAVSTRRALHLVDQIMTTSDAHVRVGRTPMLPALLVGRMRRLDIEAPRAALPTVAMVDVSLHLRDVRLTWRGGIAGGRGFLDGHVPAADVLRMAGLRGALELREGRATFLWPSSRSGLPSVGVRLRPRLSGDRVRLAPSPVTIALPALPPGCRVTSVHADADTLLITATIDLQQLFSL